MSPRRTNKTSTGIKQNSIVKRTSFKAGIKLNDGTAPFRTKIEMKNIITLFTVLIFSQWAFGQKYIDLAKVDYATSSTNTFDTGTATTSMQEMTP